MGIPRRMKFGIFMAPFHRLGENPVLSLQRDLELIQLLDQLDYDEAWVGEHHSAGWEIISSPEIFMAYAFAQTRHIKLGTGVVSLPYHNPYMVADRMVLLDHLSRGRAMLGVGPGSLPSDAYQLNLDAAQQRPQMDEALGVILRLLAGEEVTHRSDWIDLRLARLQLPPYSDPLFPVFVASTLSPAGPTTAGKYGAGVISLSAGPNPARQWELAEESAARHGKTLDRRNWRLMMPIYIAETREEAYRDVSERFYHWQMRYFGDTLGRRSPYEGPPERYAQAAAESGGAVIGSPEDAVAAIQRLKGLTGGFGGLLGLAHEWAPTPKIHQSYELFARYVAPHFQGSLDGLAASQRWAEQNRELLNNNEVGGVVGAFKEVAEAVPGVVHGKDTSTIGR